VTEDQVYYTTTGLQNGWKGIYSLRVSDRSIRAVAPPLANDVIYWAFSATGPTPSFFFQAGQPPSILYQGPSDSVFRLSVVSRFGDQAGRNADQGKAVLGFPDGSGAALITAPDSLKVFDVPTRTRRAMGVGCRGIIAFSPDASSLLCRVSGSAIDVVDLASGRHEELRVGVSSSNLRLAHWDRDGLRFISLDNETPKLVNATTGAVTLLRETSLGADESHMTDTFAWSRDGRFVAMWTRYCRPVGFGGECDKGECGSMLST
jgi:hypothetical protein